MAVRTITIDICSFLLDVVLKNISFVCGISVSAIAVIFGIRAKRFFHEPNIGIGVLPSEEEMLLKGWDSIGDFKYLDEYRFDTSFFARPVKIRNDKEFFLKIEKIEKKFPKFVRAVKRQKEGFVEIPIIIQNSGKSAANEYSLVITYSGLQHDRKDCGIRAVDIATEDSQIQCFYTQEDNPLFKGEIPANLKDVKLPAENIKRLYGRFGITADYIGLKGNSPSNTYEAVYLKLFVPNYLREFIISFKIESKDFSLYKVKRFFQLIKVE